MLTIKENLLETIRGGNPDRFVNQYEYIELVMDPTVLEGLGSDKAGMQDGDIITSVDGTTVSTSDQLREMMSYYSAGETIEVKVQRLNGNAYEEQTLQVTLSTQDETTAQSQIQNKQEK